MTPHREPGVRPVLASAERVLATLTVTGTGADDDPSNRCRASDRSSRSCAQPLPPSPRARLPRYANACRQGVRFAWFPAAQNRAQTTGCDADRELLLKQRPPRTEVQDSENTATSGSLGARRTDSVVVDQCVVDLASDEALQAADDVLLRQALGGASADVVDGRLVPAHADDHDPVESRVGMAVTATVEPMPIGDAG